jgi:hypothetical protein
MIPQRKTQHFHHSIGHVSGTRADGTLNSTCCAHCAHGNAVARTQCIRRASPGNAASLQYDEARPAGVKGLPIHAMYCSGFGVDVHPYGVR